MPKAELLIGLVVLMVLGVVALYLALEDPVVEPEKPATLDALGLPSATTHRRAVSVPVPAADSIADDKTHAIRKRVTYARFQPYPTQPPPWAYANYLHGDDEYPAQHRAPEPVFREFTQEQPVVDAPRLDWSGHIRDGVSG